MARVRHAAPQGSPDNPFHEAPAPPPRSPEHPRLAGSCPAARRRRWTPPLRRQHSGIVVGCSAWWPPSSAILVDRIKSRKRAAGSLVLWIVVCSGPRFDGRPRQDGAGYPPARRSKFDHVRGQVAILDHVLELMVFEFAGAQRRAVGVGQFRNV